MPVQAGVLVSAGVPPVSAVSCQEGSSLPLAGSRDHSPGSCRLPRERGAHGLPRPRVGTGTVLPPLHFVSKSMSQPDSRRERDHISWWKVPEVKGRGGYTVAVSADGQPQLSVSRVYCVWASQKFCVVGSVLSSFHRRGNGVSEGLVSCSMSHS